MGNIIEIFENGRSTCRYEYDALGRLTREDNVAFGKTTTWAYDNNGNIIAKYEYDITTKPTNELHLLDCTYTPYSYDDNSDMLLSCGDETFAYDLIGNPTTYRGKAAAWAYGRQLTNFDGNTFSYDARGRRTAKNSITFTYNSNGNLIKQSNGLEFLYDHTGVFAFKYNGSTYYYRKNAQQDIIAILDNYGNVVVKYKYDAWGKCNTVVLDESATEIAALNPFRYRSYYFDTETNLYFLKTRYYDPEIVRFITIDDISYLDPESINGLNLYAYCGDNPIKYSDSNGTFALTTAIIIGLIAGAVIGGTVGGVYAYNQASASGATGWDLFGHTVLGVFGGAVIGAGIGAVLGAASWGIASAITAGISVLSSGFSALSGGMFASSLATGGVVVSKGAIAGTATLGLIALILMAKIPMQGGEPNSTITQGGSTGTYDSNGNLISRHDTTGKPHYIKELGDYFLPHTHTYKWKLIDGIWRIIEKSILPF